MSDSIVKRIQFLGVSFHGYADSVTALEQNNQKAAKVTIRWFNRFSEKWENRNIFVTAARAKQFQDKGR